MTTTHDINTLFLNGADIYLSHKCGNYYEYLKMHSATITDDNVFTYTTYPSASKLYNVQGDNYNIYHCHSLDNTLMLARTRFIGGDGKFGGWFGLPNCTAIRNWPHKDQKWVLFDDWKRCALPIIDIIKSCVPVKIRITTPEFTTVSDSNFLISFDEGGYSIRTSPSAIQRDGGFDMMYFEIHNEVIKCKTWHIRKTPKRATLLWVAEKIRDVVGISKWDVSYDRISDATFDILCKKQDAGARYEFRMD